MINPGASSEKELPMKKATKVISMLIELVSFIVTFPFILLIKVIDIIDAIR